MEFFRRYWVGVAVTAATVIAFAVFAEADLFELWYEFSREHEAWNLDEVPMAVAFVGFWALAISLVYARREAKLLLLARERAEALTPASLRQYFETVEKSRVGMLFFDAEGRLVVANRAVQRLGPGADELVPGRTYAELRGVFSEYRPAETDVLALLREVSSGTITVEGVVEVTGGERAFLVTKTLVAEAGVLVLVDDISMTKPATPVVSETPARQP